MSRNRDATECKQATRALTRRPRAGCMGLCTKYSTRCYRPRCVELPPLGLLAHFLGRFLRAGAFGSLGGGGVFSPFLSSSIVAGVTFLAGITRRYLVHALKHPGQHAQERGTVSHGRIVGRSLLARFTRGQQVMTSRLRFVGACDSRGACPPPSSAPQGFFRCRSSCDGSNGNRIRTRTGAAAPG